MGRDEWTAPGLLFLSGLESERDELEAAILLMALVDPGDAVAELVP
jgi:hypothetical protein